MPVTASEEGGFCWAPIEKSGALSKFSSFCTEKYKFLLLNCAILYENCKQAQKYSS